jgi:CBS domain-containing protein
MTRRKLNGYGPVSEMAIKLFHAGTEGEDGEMLTKRLAQVMTREVATCGEAETAVSIMERMTTGKFRHIPVVERDQLVGIVSIGDIVKMRQCSSDRP